MTESPSPNATARRQIVDQLLTTRVRAHDAWTGNGGGAGAADIVALRSIADHYLESLPKVALSRCPFTGAEVRLAFEDEFLDGPWWDYELPLRPVEAAPSSLLTLTGALRLTAPHESPPFHVMPGPGMPFVVPPILDDPDVTAVLSTVRVGRNTGYVIAYFTAHPSPEPSPVPWWGSRWATSADAVGAWRVADNALLQVRATDLRPWVAAGKLRWIAPGDESTTVRPGIEACPYLDGEGVEAHQHLYLSERHTTEFRPG